MKKNIFKLIVIGFVLVFSSTSLYANDGEFYANNETVNTEELPNEVMRESSSTSDEEVPQVISEDDVFIPEE